MGALPTPQPAYRFAPYIEELHEFFADHHLYFGLPTDILPLLEQLEQPGPFRDQTSALVLSILAREGGTLSAAELLEIVAIAIGGSRIFEPSPELNQPLSRLYDIVNGIVAGSPSAEPEPEAAELVAFPIPRPRRTLHFGNSTIDLPHLPTPGPSFRKLLIAGAIAVVVAVVLAIALRPRSAAPVPSVVPSSAAAANVAHPAKPSAYGPAFTPTPPPRKHRARSKPATQSAPGASATQAENAER